MEKEFVKGATCVFLFIFLFPTYLHADIIRLNNGQSLEGKIVKESKDGVIFDVGFGTVVFERAEIKAIEKTEIVETQVEDKAVFDESLSVPQEIMEDEYRDKATQIRAAVEKRAKDIELKPFDTPFGIVYYKMPAEELEKAGYTDSLRRNGPTLYPNSLVFDDISTPEKGDAITFTIRNGKVWNWYRSPALQKKR